MAVSNKTLQWVATLVVTTGAAGCVPHTTGSTEVGVRVVEVGIFDPIGVEPTAYAPGSTFFFTPFVNGWYLFDAALQNLQMTRDVGGARTSDDSLHFKTVDGNDVSVDVTVAWRIEPKMAPYLVQFVGKSNHEVEEVLVRPVARTIIRDVLNELASEEYYDAHARFEKGEEATTELNRYLNPEGVVIAQVLLGEHKFNDAYEQVIRDKKVAEQDTERLRSESEAAREQMRRELEVAKGEVNQTIEQAKGAAQQKHISADAMHFEKEKQAEAILSEQRAKAEGIAERAKALSGSGGTAMVKLKLAEAMAGKPIVFVPAGSMGVQTTDMNALLKTYGVKAVAINDSSGSDSSGASGAK